MSHAVFFGHPFTCPHCGTPNAATAGNIYVSGIGEGLGDQRVEVGDEVVIDDGDMEEAFFVLRRPSHADVVVIAIEAWSCVVCDSVRWVRLELTRVDDARYRLASARMVPLSARFLDETNLISKKLYAWTPQAGDDVERVAAVRRHFLS